MEEEMEFFDFQVRSGMIFAKGIYTAEGLSFSFTIERDEKHQVYLYHDEEATKSQIEIIIMAFEMILEEPES